jgi:hypothetical protein
LDRSEDIDVAALVLDLLAQAELLMQSCRRHSASANSA